MSRSGDPGLELTILAGYPSPCLCLCSILDVLGCWRERDPGSILTLEAPTPAARQPSLVAADGLVRSALLKSAAVPQSAQDYTVATWAGSGVTVWKRSLELLLSHFGHSAPCGEESPRGPQCLGMYIVVVSLFTINICIRVLCLSPIFQQLHSLPSQSVTPFD